MGVLCYHYDNPIAGHFSAKHTLELVDMKYYWPGMAYKVKGYTQACSTCQRVHPMQYMLHGSMTSLPLPRGS
jgi:hypothetical protein